MNRTQKLLQRLLALVNQYGIKLNETSTCLGYKVTTYRVNNVLYLITTYRDIIIDISRYE